MSFILGLIIGLIIGVVIMCIMSVAKEADSSIITIDEPIE